MMNYLCHYGIDGQKWGVRNGPPYPLDYESHSKREKQLNGAYSISKTDSWYNNHKDELKKLAIASFAVAGVSATLYMAYKYDALSRLSGYGSSLSPNDVKEAIASSKTDTVNLLKDTVIPKGTAIFRKSIAGEDLSGKNGLHYMTYKAKDALIYEKGLKNWHDSDEKLATQIYKAVDDIRIPSREVLEKEIYDSYINDSKYRRELIQTYHDCFAFAIKKNYGISDSSSEFLLQQVDDAAWKAVKDAFSSKKSKVPVSKIQEYAFVNKSSESSVVIKKLVEKGYSAIEDYFDKDEGTLGKNPIIYIGSESNSKIVKVGEASVGSLKEKISQLKLADLRILR